ncbi:MAG: dockerin type I domain-containing protein [Planctomycetaceae bacterium]|nr:dockerin type I domain-containing protein [Planctomycetaceae bacterium]
MDPVQTNLWNDTPSQWVRASVIEWSADCNSDGIVDFGQIRNGDLEDSNANNIPDCCEQGTSCFCPGDTNDDGTVDGIDLATVLTRWGQSGSKFPDADCNNDGAIDGSDLAVVLGSWGSCPANAG